MHTIPFIKAIGAIYIMLALIVLALVLVVGFLKETFGK